MTSRLRSLWTAPAATPPPPRRVWRDWALVAVIPVVAVIEAATRPDVPWGWLWAAVLIALVPTLLWRRTRPLLMLAIAFGVGAVGTLVTGSDPQFFTTVYFLILLYAVMRWGTGRAMLVGAAIVVGSFLLSLTLMPMPVARRHRRHRGGGHDGHPRRGVPLARRGPGPRARPREAARTRTARTRSARHRRAPRLRDRDPGPGRHGGRIDRPGCRSRGAPGHRGRGIPHAR